MVVWTRLSFVCNDDLGKEGKEKTTDREEGGAKETNGKGGKGPETISFSLLVSMGEWRPRQSLHEGFKRSCKTTISKRVVMCQSQRLPSPL